MHESIRTRVWARQRGGIGKGCLVALLIPIGLVVILGVMSIGKYNGLVAQREKTEAAWSGIDNQYKRRADLIDNLVATVKGAADFEKSTLTEVTEARASVGRVQLPPGLPTDPKALEA